MAYDDTEEQPLDPVLERVRKKMVRLLVISIGIMMIGLLAVLFAIIYKITNPEEGSEEDFARVPRENVEINLGLPADAEILSTTVQGDRLVLNLKRSNGKTQIVIVDTKTGQLISRINVN